MFQTTVALPEIHLVGISVRTSYENEIDKMKGKIFPCVQRYFHGSLIDKIPNRKKPGVTYCVYTNYESDCMGAYTYFIGEEVSTFDTELPDGYQKITLPQQIYTKFTTNPAPMPDVIVNAWETIWKMTPKELGGKRVYHSDFEVYDERAADHNKVVLDIYVGIDT